MRMFHIYSYISLVAVVAADHYSQSSICSRCDCHGPVLDCFNKSLTEIPHGIPENTTKLILKHNHIMDIPDYSFNHTNLQYLDISENKINNLGENSFYGLDELLFLSLKNNSINLVPANYPQGVFEPLDNLRILDISSNILDLNTPLEYPSSALSDLRSLQHLYLDGIENLILGGHFANLTSLTHLKISGNCLTQNIQKDSFINVAHLRELVIKGCRLRNIDNSSLGVFKQLELLDISFNQHLGFDAAFNALASLTCPSFRILDVSAIVQSFAIGIVVTGLHISQIAHMDLTEIYLDHNRIELFEAVALPQVPKTIKYISIRDHRLTYGQYILGTSNLKELICLDGSDGYQSHIPVKFPSRSTNDILYMRNTNIAASCPYKRNQSDDGTTNISARMSTHIVSTAHARTSTNSVSTAHSSSTNIESTAHARTSTNIVSTAHKIDHFNFGTWLSRASPSQGYWDIFTWNKNKNLRDTIGFNMKIELPPNLEFINSSYCALRYSITRLRFDKNKIRTVDLSNNILSKWYGPITGVNAVEWFSLSMNYCDEIHEDFFSNDFINLRELHLAQNFLAVPFEIDVQGKIFKHLTNLSILDISDNKIRSLPSKLLKAQTMLTHLDLSKNMMKTWTLDIEHMLDLEYIDLSTNMLSDLPVKFRDFADRQFNTGKRLSVNLLEQTLQCTCGELGFLKWMKSNTTDFIRQKDYKCVDQNGRTLSLSNLDLIILNLEKKCVSYTMMTIILTFGILMLFLVILVSLMYRYRWKLRYLYYLTRSRYKAYTALDGEEDFEFDAFVSYADDDRALVVTDMIARIEQAHDLKLCIHHRDFLVGEDIAANISNAVRKSKKTLILLSRHFMNSYWCTYELNMAKIEAIATGRNVLIVIIYEHIPVHELSEDIVELMKNDSYVEYTEDAEGQVVFWDNLVRAIKAD